MIPGTSRRAFLRFLAGSPLFAVQAPDEFVISSPEQAINVLEFEAAAKKALTSPPLAAKSALDAKYTTADLAKQLASHALYGPPTGKKWEPTEKERRDHPEIKALEPHPWTVLTITPAPK